MVILSSFEQIIIWYILFIWYINNQFVISMHEKSIGTMQSKHGKEMKLIKNSLLTFKINKLITFLIIFFLFRLIFINTFPFGVIHHHQYPYPSSTLNCILFLDINNALIWQVPTSVGQFIFYENCQS
jgi:hypothetical protein